MPESPDPDFSNLSASDREPLPNLAEALEKIPETSRELIEEEFRGRFTGMRKIDPEKLY